MDSKAADAETTARFNARLAMASSFLSDLIFILPIWLLYSINILHFSPALAVVIFTSIWAGSALLEVPTGALADRLGRKKMFLIGQFLLALYPLAYAFEFPMMPLLLIGLVSALGSALRSGALLPIVHQSYEQAGLGQKAYERFLSTNQVVLFLARALSGVAGAALYSVNPKWPFFAMTVVTMLNFGLGFLIRGTVNDKKAAQATNREHITHTIRVMKQSRVIVGIVIGFVLFDLVLETIWTGYQVLYEADGRSALVIGTLFSVIALCSALGAYLVRFMGERVHPIRVMQLLGLSILLTAALLAQPNIAVRLLAIVPMSLMSGTIMVTINATIQKEVANRYHSTALSVASFLQYGLYATGSVAFGVLLQLFGDATTRRILLISSAAAVVGMGLYVRRQAELQAYTMRASNETADEPVTGT